MLQRALLYSVACKYAIKAAVFLARQPEGAHLSCIAEQCDLPRDFLAIILQRLVRQGILSSSKGPSGGFQLRRDPADIRLWDLVEAIDEENCCCRCALGFSGCSPEAPCAMHDGWQEVRGSIQAYLQETTIAQLAANFERQAGTPRFPAEPWEKPALASGQGGAEATRP